jgi:broad specificity phosphatase PhoE
MNRQLILVKHSLPALEPDKPANQWRLSEEGQQRCEVLARHLSPYLPFELFSSIETKAAQTAALAASRLGIPWQEFPGLHEHERSEVGFCSPEQFQANMQSFFNHPAEVVFGTESAEQALARFSKAIQVLCKNHPPCNGRLVVVAHGTVISLFVAHWGGLPAYPLWEQLGLPAFVVLDLPIELHQHSDIRNPVHIFNPYRPGAPVQFLTGGRSPV